MRERFSRKDAKAQKNNQVQGAFYAPITVHGVHPACGTINTSTSTSSTARHY
jgi:hypothetical protein